MSEPLDLDAEVRRLTEHSIQLNSIAWRIAGAVGRVPKGAERIESDFDDDLTTLIAERDDLRAEVRQLSEEVLACDVLTLRAQVEAVRALADEWRYKGENGWGPWQVGDGPDHEGQILDTAATRLIRALDGEGK